MWINDVISREALKEEIEREVRENRVRVFVANRIFKVIDNAPIVTYPFYQEAYQTGYEECKNERPQGKWIKNKGRDLRDCFYTCSKCGRNINVICGETLADYPFCHCGAKMDGKEADNERPHGKWLSNCRVNGVNFGRSCSLCGKVVEFSENFCPNCGADMRG